MCNFFSAVVLRNGDVLSHPMLDSHSDLVRYFKLPDTEAYIQHFAKVELTPTDWMDVDTWVFRVDDAVAPPWWDDVAAQVEQTVRDRVRGMVISVGTRDLIVDGSWIVGGTARVSDMRAGRIVHVGGSAQIHDVGDSAQIHDVGDSAQIHDVWGAAQIHDVWGAAQIHDVRGSAQIHRVRGSAQLDASAKDHLVNLTRVG